MEKRGVERVTERGARVRRGEERLGERKRGERRGEREESRVSEKHNYGFRCEVLNMILHMV